MIADLKSHAGRRQLIGQPLDHVLGIATKNRYDCHVIYDDLKSNAARRRELIVYVEDGIVAKIR